MQIGSALRKRIEKFLPNNYRAVIVARLEAQGKKYHPNTVRNVLFGSANATVALELIKLAKEGSDSQKKAEKLVRML